jgi:hypothetical protein
LGESRPHSIPERAPKAAPSDEIRSTNDLNAEKIVYAKAFQAWTDGRIEGTQMI